ncbi:MAG: hypothetical protein AAGN46_15610 [Acidobacteriota bacterium]
MTVGADRPGGLEAACGSARSGRLYPSTIVYGGDDERRRRAAMELARSLLCDRPPAERGCDPSDDDVCRHCRRLRWPERGAEHFHPDLHVLERDLKTSTSIDATKAFLRGAWEAPYEAQGQVFVVAEAHSLGAGAADSLLKMLEEPPERSPRHFILLAPSRLDLSATLRSRSLSVFLSATAQHEPERVDALARALGPPLDGFFASGSTFHLLAAASVLEAGADGWDDARARRPWELAAAAVLGYLHARRGLDRPPGDEASAALGDAQRRALLALAEALLDAPRLRLRAIAPARILEGLLVRHLLQATN